jgi:hypothetical protein
MQRRHLLATSAALALGGLLTTTPYAAEPPKKRRKSTGLFVNQVRGAAGAFPSGGTPPNTSRGKS